ncbi:ATPase [Candidatus Symbiothrix dinenymphae]|nr:ATPase [Candidatus Symbiothrix dinenymphae]
MKRQFEHILLQWKQRKKPLPLMLVGARQTGKTHLLSEFCHQNFEEVLEINFAEKAENRDFFTPSLVAAEILERMELFFNRKIDASKTIFFFDEIQDCEEAIASLKYFAESPVEYKIVTAGSLLGVKINRIKTSFPVGKVQIEYLYPMDFEEFLWALGEHLLADEIRKHYVENKPFSPIIHHKALQLYRAYLCVGGMPAAVVNFVENKFDLMQFETGITANILAGYLADMTKYADSVSSVKIHSVYRTMPEQLAKTQSKFMYKTVEPGGKKEKFQSSIEWLIQANMVLPCILVEKPQHPLAAYFMESMFKLYLSDVGLLVSLARLKFGSIITNADMMYRGFLTENYIAQTFAAHGVNLNYWNSGNRAEIDFLAELADGIIPIEVKAAENVRSHSLAVYVEKYKPKYAIRMSSKNFGFENNIKSVPLYAAHCIN